MAIRNTKKKVLLPSILKSDQTLFKPEEIQREFRLSRATTYRLLVGYADHPPVIPSVRLGKLIRIPRGVVEKIVSGELPLAAEGGTT